MIIFKYFNKYLKKMQSIKYKEIKPEFLRKVIWSILSENPSAIHLLEKNLDRVSWYWLSWNPIVLQIICDIDYEEMKKKIQPLAEELTKYVFNPNRIKKMANTYQLNFEELLEIY